MHGAPEVMPPLRSRRPRITRRYFSPKYSAVAASACAASVARFAAGTDVPHTTLYPLSVDVPQTTDDPVSTLSPLDRLETTDVPHTTDVPQTTDVPHTTDEFVTIYTLPFASTDTAGDWAEPIVDDAVSVFCNAA
jgi:hypothetical protein